MVCLLRRSGHIIFMLLYGLGVDEKIRHLFNLESVAEFLVPEFPVCGQVMLTCSWPCTYCCYPIVNTPENLAAKCLGRFFCQCEWFLYVCSPGGREAISRLFKLSIMCMCTIIDVQLCTLRSHKECWKLPVLLVRCTI